MTQVSIIRKQLLEGHTLTQRSALLDFGIMALPRRIADLRETGFPVRVEMKTNPNTGQRYASYSFEEEITHIKQLKRGHVYRVYDVSTHPFAGELMEMSDGYFVFEGKNLGINMATIQMGGKLQLFIQEWLTNGDFKVKYIGGMS